MPSTSRAISSRSLEKMMHYKRSILDELKGVLPLPDDNRGRRLTLVEECHRRWMENARNGGKEAPR